MRFHNQDNFVDIDLASQSPTNTPPGSDVHLTIRVSSRGFAGHNEVWVLAASFKAFCRSLVDLERDRAGEAVLEALSPDECRIVVRSVDSRGHMAVGGATGYAVQMENCLVWHSVTFGFEFDPSQLIEAVKVDWLLRDAEPSAHANRPKPTATP